MAAEDQARLLELAESVADRTAVDWAEESSRRPGLAALIAQLRQVDAVAAAYRDVQVPGEVAAGGEPVLFTWGPLQVVEEIGRGAFGEVYRAHDPSLHRMVALKLRRPGPSHFEGGGSQFVEEARRLARIRHDNVVAVYGVDLHDDRVGLWTELIEGSTLAERLAADGPLGAAETAAVGLDLSRALAAVHGAGLIHGDVKAANVLRERGGRIVLTDLGSSIESGAGPQLFGSPASLAPEVLLGAAPSPRADLYALGVLLFQLLTGELPVVADNPHQLLERHRRGERRSLRGLRPDLPEPLVRVVERLLEPDPAERYAGAGELERDLGRLGAEAPATGPAEASRAPSWWLRPAALAALTMAGAVALAVLLGRSTAPGLRAVHDTPATAAATAVGVHAVLLRGGPAPEVLASGATVAPGDRLHLEVDTTEEVHLVVLNEDRQGSRFVLFPVPGLGPSNPLPAGRHRLPGRLDGVEQDWRVTSAGGTETFLVVASRLPLHEVEAALARFAAATSGAGGEAAGSDPLRGVGGLVQARDAGDGALAELERTARGRRGEDGSVWVARWVLHNPE